MSLEPDLLQRLPECLCCYRRHGHGDGGITPAWDRPSAARGPSCPVRPRGVMRAGDPGVALGPGHLSPASSPVGCRLATGGSGGGWGWDAVQTAGCQRPISLHPVEPPYSPRPQSPRQGLPAYLPPVGAGGPLRVPGAESLVTPPQQAGSAPRLPSGAMPDSPTATTVDPGGPQPRPALSPPLPLPHLSRSHQSFQSTHCAPELGMPQSPGTETEKAVME